MKELIKNPNPVIMEIGAANGDDTADFLKLFEGMRTSNSMPLSLSRIIFRF
jgi:hypothetical protein